MLYEYFTEATITATTQSMQLAIDECEEWILEKELEKSYVKKATT
jgi:hypothetical protein